MKQFLITVAGVFLGLALFLVGVPLVLFSMAASAASPDQPPNEAVLNLDLRTALADQSPANPLWGLGRNTHSVMSIVETLDRAEEDDRVKALFVRLPESGIEPAMADEIRGAFLRFRAAGKPIYAHSQGIYPAGVVTTAYMLGAAADQFWMQPGASLQVTGLATEDLFLKRFFDKYGVVAQFEQRREYKTAVSGYLTSDYTPAHRDSTLSWLTSVYEANLASAAADRKIAPAALRTRLEAGPYGAEDAVRLKLIDKLGQVREALDALTETAGDGDGLEAFDFWDYADSGLQAPELPGDAIALIEAEGPILTGDDGGGNPFTGGATIYSDDLASAILQAAETESVKAIVLRLNSPGGSDTASEQVLDAVRAARAAGKPVVVSMGAYAASGGYWIASGANEIVAQPTTLTGSIGVYGGKFAIGPALARFGVDVRELGVGGDYANAFGLGDGFSPQQRAAFAAWMDRTYEGFIARVASGRKLTPERVREIAGGRVWTGAQAKTLGLVDHLGGFPVAVERARALAKLDAKAPLRRMTPTEGALEAFQNALGVSAMSARTLAAAAWVLGDPRAQSVLDELAETRLRGQGATVLAPTPW